MGMSRIFFKHLFNHLNLGLFLRSVQREQAQVFTFNAIKIQIWVKVVRPLNDNGRTELREALASFIGQQYIYIESYFTQTKNCKFRFSA